MQALLTNASNLFLVNQQKHERKRDRQLCELVCERNKNCKHTNNIQKSNVVTIEFSRTQNPERSTSKSFMRLIT